MEQNEYETCNVCEGSGNNPSALFGHCGTCNGTGEIEKC